MEQLFNIYLMLKHMISIINLIMFYQNQFKCIEYNFFSYSFFFFYFYYIYHIER